MLAGYCATKRHCLLYVMSGSVLGPFRDELRAYDASQGTIRFTTPARTETNASAKTLGSSSYGSASTATYAGQTFVMTKPRKLIPSCCSRGSPIFRVSFATRFFCAIRRARNTRPHAASAEAMLGLFCCSAAGNDVETGIRTP